MQNETTSTTEQQSAPATTTETAAPSAKAPRKAKPAKKAKMPKTSTKPKAKAKKAKSVKGARMADVLHAAAAQYDRPKGKDGKPLKTASGKSPIVDSGDKVAIMLRGKDLEDIYALVAKRLDVPVKELKGRYGKLNVGQQRMNLGNRLRAVVNSK